MVEKPFQGIATFLKAPVADLSRPIGVVGIPFDGATSFRSGARFGPNAVRQASMMLTDGAHPLFETEPGAAVTDLGDIAVSNLDVGKSLAQITEFIAGHPFAADPGKRLLFVGGDHTVTTGILRALAPRHDGLVVVHFDAHCDTWADHFGDPLGHGTWVRNVVEEGLVRPADIIQIGIRSPVDPETKRWLPERGGRVLTARDALDRGAEAVARLIAESAGGRPVYVSFDIDALDPAYAPGTGTPEIAGLTPHVALGVLERLTGVVAMDVVETAPPYDPTGVTALSAATLLWTGAALMLAERR